MASWRAFRYALFASSPVSSHGMCFGLGIARAAGLFSPFGSALALPLRAILLASERGDPGAGDGVIFTMSAKELGVAFSLWPWPCPPRFP